MPTASANPDLQQLRWEWHNRVRRWRAQPGESVFVALASLAFVLVALWLAEPLWPRLLRAEAPWVRGWPLAAIAAAVALLLGLQSRRARGRLARAQQSDWLAAMPVATRMRANARALRAGASATLSAALLIGLYGWASSRVAAPAALGLALGVGACAGVLLAWLLPEGRPRPEQVLRQRAIAVAIPAGTSGLALLGAALEPAVARLPRGAPWVAAGFLLLPPSTPALAIPALMLLFTAVSMAFDLVAHWRARFLADQAWLAALPLRPERLFGAYLATLARRGGLLVLLVGGCLHLLGAPALFAWLLALTLALVLVDALLCGFATRRDPARFALLAMLHGCLLLASTQVLPPALPLVYAGCAWSAWRRGLR